MAEQRQNVGQVQPYQQQQYPTDVIKGKLPDNSPSKSQVLAVVTLLPIGGTLLLFSGLTLAGTLTGLAVTTPLFVIFSPVLVPAVVVIGLAVMGFLSSGAFGIVALSALSWMVNFLRKVGATDPEQIDHVKRRVQDTAGQIGQKAKETGQNIKSKAQEAKDERRDRT